MGKDTSLHNRGHQLFTDNWFTGIGALKVCTQVGVGFTGTARVDRMGKAFTDTKEVTKKWERGRYRVSKTAMNGVSVWAHQWMDSKLVNMLTTNESKEGIAGRRVVDKKTRKYTRQTLTQPTIYSLYNFGKVGTDRMDQVVGDNYRNTRYRWHVKIILHIFYMCLANAWVTYRQVEPGHDDMPLHEYAELAFVDLQESLVKVSEGPRCPVVSSTHTPWWKGKTTASRPVAVAEVDGGRVLPAVYKRHRPKCVVCYQCTPYKCKECDTYLCIATDVHEGRCWQVFHLQ